MKIHFLILFFLLRLCSVCVAQNQLVYLRYDEFTDNVIALHKRIESLYQHCEGQFLLFYNNHIYQSEELEDLLNQKNFLANLNVYEPVVEFEEYNSALTKLLDESITASSLLVGNLDYQWNLIFVLHENDSRDDLSRLIDINELTKRQVNISIITFDDKTNFTNYSYTEFIKSIPTILNF